MLTAPLETMGQRLRYARERRGIKSRELARLASLKSESHVSLIEGDRGRVALDIVSSLAKALNVSLDWLVNGGELPDDLRAPISDDEPDTADDSPAAKRKSDPPPKRAAGASR